MQVKSGILFLAWSWSGSTLALAQEDGCISLQDKLGVQLAQSSCKGTIAGLAWRPIRSALHVTLTTAVSAGAFYSGIGKSEHSHQQR